MSARRIEVRFPSPGEAGEPSTCIDAEPYALQVKDDSMEPEFERGCIIVIDPTGVARAGAFVLAEQDGALLFRRVARMGEVIELVPLNPRYPKLTLGDGCGAIRGVIVQRAGRRRSYHKRYP
jgi:SOS-response transcriptional repressor LexA